MTTADEYLKDVHRAMVGMTPSVRQDILRELRGHITDSSAANGGNVRASLEALGSPRDVGRRYRDLYGYSGAFKAVFGAIAFLLAVPSVPVLVAGTGGLFPFALSILFVMGAAAWILWVSVVAGSRAGAQAGVSALVGRFAGFGFAVQTQTGADASTGGLVLLVAVAVLFVLLGWLPGTAKKAWSGSEGGI